MKALIALLFCLATASGCTSSPRIIWQRTPPPKEVVEQLPALIEKLDFSKGQSQSSVMEQLGLGPWFKSLDFWTGARHCARTYSMNDTQHLDLVIGLSLVDTVDDVVDTVDDVVGVILSENDTPLVININDDLLENGHPYKNRCPKKKIDSPRK